MSSKNCWQSTTFILSFRILTGNTLSQESTRKDAGNIQPSLTITTYHRRLPWLHGLLTHSYLLFKQYFHCILFPDIFQGSFTPIARSFIGFGTVSVVLFMALCALQYSVPDLFESYCWRAPLFHWVNRTGLWFRGDLRLLWLFTGSLIIFRGPS